MSNTDIREELKRRVEADKVELEQARVAFNHAKWVFEQADADHKASVRMYRREVELWQAPENHVNEAESPLDGMTLKEACIQILRDAHEEEMTLSDIETALFLRGWDFGAVKGGRAIHAAMLTAPSEIKLAREGVWVYELPF